MAAVEANDAEANTTAAINDFFISYLAKKQPRPAAWFSRIGELHRIKSSIKRTEIHRSVRFLMEMCRKSRVSAWMRFSPALHRERGRFGMRK
jgi:hypothetical protein